MSQTLERHSLNQRDTFVELDFTIGEILKLQNSEKSAELFFRYTLVKTRDWAGRYSLRTSRVNRKIEEICRNDNRVLLPVPRKLHLP